MTDTEDEIEEQDSGHTSYTSCSLDKSQRTIVSKLYSAWKQLGWKPSQFEHLLETAGFQIPRRTLNHWITTKPDSDDTTSPPRKQGRPRLLDEAGSDTLVGYCIQRIMCGESVHLQTVQDFCRDYLDCEISLSTASGILAERGFSSRIAQVSSSGICDDIRKMAQICSDWINEQRKTGMLSGDPLLIGSLDFSYTKHTTSRPTTFAIKGGLVKIISLKLLFSLV